MKQYKPNIHHRRSIRLKGYDYSQAELYFITICCQYRACLFGKIVDGKMICNDAGKIFNPCWLDMPNHIHGIVEIVWAKNISPDNSTTDGIRTINITPLPRPNGTSKTIGSMVRGFKIGVTKWMRQNTNVYDVWQRNYYENLIRNSQSYQTISQYIIDNPAKWMNDNILKDLCKKYDFSYPDDKLIDLSKAVKVIVDSQAKFPDWNKRDEVYVEIFEQAENFKKNRV